MQIDESHDDNLGNDHFESSPRSPLSSGHHSSLDFNDKPEYLKKVDFLYSMKMIDSKLNSLYKLCRYISDQQHEDSKLLHKLVTADELSNDFWNVSNFNKVGNSIILI